MSTIDDVISPYADSQPPHIFVRPNNLTIERFPMLVTPEGIHPEFLNFYNTVVDAILSGNYEALYEVSDKALSLEDFKKNLNSIWGKTISDALAANHPVDIELNMDRFSNLHRNILAGFNIMIVRTDIKSDPFNEHSPIITLPSEKAEVSLWATEILFTYKSGFRLLSSIQQFYKIDKVR